MTARRTSLLLLVLLLAAGSACSEGPPQQGDRAPAPSALETAWVEIAGELFELELALDAPSRFRGLAGRRAIAPDGGMLFVFPRTRPLQFVMRHCPVPIDVAFLDESGRIVALHEMQPEPPQGPEEPFDAYERRLTGYTSGVPARFAIETAGGRLEEVGARVGQQVVFDTEKWKALAR